MYSICEPGVYKEKGLECDRTQCVSRLDSGCSHLIFSDQSATKFL